MRNRLIAAGIGILSVAAWTATLDAGPPGHGPSSGSPAYGSLVVYPRYIQYHTENIGGLLFPVQVEINPSLFPGLPDLVLSDQDTSAGGAFAGDHHGFGDHHATAASYPHTQVVVHEDQAKDANSHATAPHAAGSDQAGAVTLQPQAVAGPLVPRPPGTAGPGQRVSGTSGPGLAGPGRRMTPRW
jgi:hypothetical protein